MEKRQGAPVTVLETGVGDIIRRGDIADTALVLWALCMTIIAFILLRALVQSNRSLARAAQDIAEAQDNAKDFIRELAAFNRAQGVE